MWNFIKKGRTTILRSVIHFIRDDLPTGLVSATLLHMVTFNYIIMIREPKGGLML